MRIREVIPEDRNELLEILKATGVFQDYEISVADEVFQESLKPASDYQSYCFENGENHLIGYVCWGATPCTTGTYDLYWIAVHPEYQGNGVGKKLLQFAEQNVKSVGGRLMIIETSSMNEYDETRKFYVSNGYRQLAMVPDFYRMGDHKIIYGKNFLS